MKELFPIFQNKPDLVYLDSAATSMKPQSVIEAELRYYTSYTSNVHRGLYPLAVKATNEYESAREIIKKFFNSGEAIFTKSATEALNLLAYILIPELKGSIAITAAEHHSNYLPWVELARKFGKKVVIIDTVSPSFSWDLFTQMLPDDVALVSFGHVSNVLGTEVDVESTIRSIRKNRECYVVVDAAQSASHGRVDLKKWDADFIAVSGHKMFGPTGIGVLLAKSSSLTGKNPFMFGGEMVASVSEKSIIYEDVPGRYEAGTQPIAQAIALAEASRCIQKVGKDTIDSTVEAITKHARQQLDKSFGDTIEWVSRGNDTSGILTWNMKGTHPHDLAEILGQEGVCVRAGHHCASMLHRKLGIDYSLRASFHIYNTEEDVEKLIKALEKSVSLLSY